jgi:flavin-dependent dehydrogenase
MKVLILGASSSGLYTALSLAQKRNEVILCEKESFFEGRRLILTSYFLKNFPIKPKVLYKVKGYRFVVGETEAIFPLKEPDVVIDRRDLLLELLKGCEACGVSIRWEWEFEKMASTKAFFSTPKGQKEIEADYVVDAMGVKSPLRMALTPSPNLVFLKQVQIIWPSFFKDDLSTIWLRPDLTPYFFWLFPDSPKTGVFGVIGEDREQTEKALFQLAEEKRLELGGRIEEGWVSLFQPRFSPKHKNVFFIGDSAGHVKPTTVGGVVSGLRGAKALAESLSSGKDYSKELLPLKRELMIHHLLRRLLNTFDEEDYRKLIKALKGSSLLGKVCRDTLLSDLFLLGIKSPVSSFKLFVYLLPYLMKKRRWKALWKR